MDCLAGSYAGTTGQATCTLCEAGKFQDAAGRTICKTCIPGYYCKEGASTPIPCPGGTFGNGTGLESNAQCKSVSTGWWAPTGSALPEACFSGFYCPGASADEQFGGSKPIIIPVGSSTATEVVETIEKEMTLSITREEYNETAVRYELAALYGVPVELIELSPLDERRLRARVLQGGLQIKFTIHSVAPPSSPGARSAAIDLDALVAAVNSVDDTELAASMSSALGTNITVESANAITAEVLVVVETDCPRGYWCTAGEQVACEIGFYQPVLNVNSAQGCLPCMANGKTNTEAATAESDCVCSSDLGFMEVSAGGNRTCGCPAGYQPNEQTPVRCVPCALGAWKDTAGNQLCKSCPSETTTVVPGIAYEADCVCIAGMYDGDDGPESRTCVACPLGTDCVEAGVTLSHLPLAPGYWRSHDASHTVLPCLTEGLCLGGNGNGSYCKTAFCSGPENANRTAGCRPGHEGPYCENCIFVPEERWYKAQGVCQKCIDGADISNYAIPAAVMLVALLSCMLFLLKGKVRSKKLTQVVREQTKKISVKLHEKLDETFQGHDDADQGALAIQEDAIKLATLKKLRESAKRLTQVVRERTKSPLAGLGVDFKILISLVQVLGALEVNFSIPFPPIFSGLMRVLGTVELPLLEMMPLACRDIRTNFHHIVVLRTVFLMVWFLTCIAIKMSCRCGLRTRQLADKTMSTAFFLLFLLYPSNSQKVFSMMLCEPFDDGTRALRVDWCAARGLRMRSDC